MPGHLEKEPKDLEKQIQFMILAHQAIVDLLKTPNLALAIERLKNSEVRRVAAADPMKAAREAGVIFPAKGFSIQIHEFPQSWEVEFQIEVADGLLITGFNSRRGFFTL